MSTNHHVQLVIESGELHPRFVCTAPEDADCRRCPEDFDRRNQESWSSAEATKNGYPCWAVDWIDVVGIEDAIICPADQVLASVPVTISYDEGVEIMPVTQDVLADMDALAQARSDAAWVEFSDRQGGA